MYGIPITTTRSKGDNPMLCQVANKALEVCAPFIPKKYWYDNARNAIQMYRKYRANSNQELKENSLNSRSLAFNGNPNDHRRINSIFLTPNNGENLNCAVFDMLTVCEANHE